MSTIHQSIATAPPDRGSVPFFSAHSRARYRISKFLRSTGGGHLKMTVESNERCVKEASQEKKKKKEKRENKRTTRRFRGLGTVASTKLYHGGAVCSTIARFTFRYPPTGDYLLEISCRFRERAPLVFSGTARPLLFAPRD